ncbi:hypothetical protein CASFOL_026313 [Castilleja foliolosa]|uniref:Uncharacterized protein n=1 Tax=Castilleja foliolosa TaxID=1961234 RepID=A0ABD3CGU8_9LAMI
MRFLFRFLYSWNREPKQQVWAAASGYGLEGYLTGDITAPATLITATDGVLTPNPEYSKWRRQDQLLVSWLLSSLTESLLITAVGLSTTSHIWRSIENVFANQNKAKVMQIRLQLQTLKKGGLSMREYLNKIKSCCDLLSAAGEKLSESDQLLYILGGLGVEMPPSSDHIDTLFKWVPDQRIIDKIEETYLYKYKVAIGEKLHHNGSFSDVIIQSYNEVDSCFDFEVYNGSVEKFYFGLEDIFYITGLPVKGSPLVESDVNVRELCQELLGFEAPGNGVDLLLKNLRENLEVSPQDADEIFLEKDVPLIFLKFLRELENVNDHAWGAGLLANIHYGLTMAKVNNLKSVSTLLLPMYVFAILRLKAFATFYKILPDANVLHFPLVGEGVRLIKKADRNVDAHTVPKRLSLRQKSKIDMLDTYDGVKPLVPEGLRSQASLFRFEDHTTSRSNTHSPSDSILTKWNYAYEGHPARDRDPHNFL